VGARASGAIAITKLDEKAFIIEVAVAVAVIEVLIIT
jgi:hypothetical protein